MTSRKLLVLALFAACAPGSTPPKQRSGALTAGASWLPIGKGMDKNTSDSTVHHSSGRSAQTAWAFDAHQGRDVLWNGTSHGGLWKSIWSGGTLVRWEPVSDNFPGSHTLGSFLLQRFDSDKILISTGSSWGDGSGVYRSLDGGASWSGNTLGSSPKHGWRLVADSSDPTGDTVVLAASSGLWRSHDFGATWPEHLYTAGELDDVVQDAGNASRWFAGAKGVGVVYSSDGGNTWCTLGSGLDGGNTRVSIAQSAADPRWLYALTIDSNSGMRGIFRHGSLDTLAACDGAAHGGAWTEITGAADHDALDQLNQGFHTAGLAAEAAQPEPLVFPLH